MSIAGRASPVPDAPIDIARIRRAGAWGAARSHRGWGGTGVQLASTDDGTLASRPDGSACAFDGRIDNREELAHAIGVAATGDAATLALAAFGKWGDDFARHIIGDWSCAVWDAAGHRLVLAVDPMAMRPLHYHLAADGTISVASEARSLHADPDIPRDLDDERIAALLCLIAVEGRRSFFRGISSVPPGGLAVWRAGRVATSTWWHPLDAPMLRLKRHEDYVDAVRACFEQAVACRIAGDVSVGSHLSGGLDSGSVTAIAARQLAAQGRRLTAFTAVPAHPHPASPRRFTNEWNHAAAVAALYPNLDHIAISTDDAPMIEVMDRRANVQDTPLLNLANGIWSQGIDRSAKERGIGVMLTGAMGNMTFSWDGSVLPTMLLRSGRVIEALRVMTAYRRTMDSRWLGIAGAAADALLPTRLVRRLRALLGQRPTTLAHFSAIHPDFLASSGLGARLADYSGDLRDEHRGDSRALRLAVLRRADGSGAFGAAARRMHGIDTRDPTIDRRLFELTLAIPEDQYLHNGMPRAIARDAMADVLPPMVTRELGRGLQAADWATTFDEAIPAMRDELARLRASPTCPGWIDLDRMDALLDRWQGPQSGKVEELNALALTRALAVGRFVRGVEGGNA